MKATLIFSRRLFPACFNQIPSKESLMKFFGRGLNSTRSSFWPKRTSPSLTHPSLSSTKFRRSGNFMSQLHPNSPTHNLSFHPHSTQNLSRLVPLWRDLADQSNKKDMLQSQSFLELQSQSQCTVRNQRCCPTIYFREPPSRLSTLPLSIEPAFLLFSN